MEIVIDIEDSMPIFSQLVNQIKQAVSKDQLSIGDPLPSIRQLANELDINQKTVAKAYRMLERDAVIETKGYRGTFIHPQAKTNCEIDLSAAANERLANIIKELKSANITDSEIRIAFNKIMNNQSDQGV